MSRGEQPKLRHTDDPQGYLISRALVWYLARLAVAVPRRGRTDQQVVDDVAERSTHYDMWSGALYYPLGYFLIAVLIAQLVIGSEFSPASRYPVIGFLVAVFAGWRLQVGFERVSKTQRDEIAARAAEIWNDPGSGRSKAVFQVIAIWLGPSLVAGLLLWMAYVFDRF